MVPKLAGRPAARRAWSASHSTGSGRPAVATATVVPLGSSRIHDAIEGRGSVASRNSNPDASSHGTALWNAYTSSPSATAFLTSNGIVADHARVRIRIEFAREVKVAQAHARPEVFGHDGGIRRQVTVKGLQPSHVVR